MPSPAAVVLAGGSGTRVGAAGNKVYLPLRDRPMIAWSVAAFTALPEFGTVVLVVRDGEQALARDAVGSGPVIVAGGANRQESELAALRALAPAVRAGEIDVVLVHDGARPLVDAALVREVLRVARTDGGAVPGLPRPGLAVAGEDGTLAGPADGLVAVQTPQGFRARPLLDAYTAAAADGFAGTDTAACVARYAPDVPIRWVPGSPHNIKVTYAHDLTVAERLLD
ncbi:IspD/TarI family cytidylyltransferase [Pseudonocardia sp. CA-107938]|uniref:IspD/TarI family cytidylyltransferase n=1 Tax=Pseudonocardia sp. CA-107938 TaxID=3240021 RepID=UPI003D8C34A2